MEAVEVVQAEVIAALVHAFTGDLDQARASLDRWAGAALAADLDSAWPGLMMNLADLVVTVGGRPAADTVRRAIEPFGVVWVVAGIGTAVRGPLDRTWARSPPWTAIWTPRTPTSRRHEAALRTGAILVAAIVDQEGGRALGDCSRLNRAGDVWRRVGATRRVAQIEALTRSPTPGEQHRPISGTGLYATATCGRSPSTESPVRSPTARACAISRASSPSRAARSPPRT